MSKFTPGPWTTDYDLDGCTVDKEGSLIAVTNDRDFFSTGYDTKTCRANARLIAAAPDMLAALNMTLNYVRGEGTAEEIVREAISKAIGEGEK